MSENGFPQVDLAAWRQRVELDLPVEKLISTSQSGLEIQPLRVERPPSPALTLGNRTVNTIAYSRGASDLARRVESDRALGIRRWWIRAEQRQELPAGLNGDGEFWIDLLPGEDATGDASHLHLSDAFRAVAEGEMEATYVAHDAARENRAFLAPGSLFREAGAHEVLELALLIGAGIEWLRLGVSPERVVFRSALGVDVLVEIAKLRALRKLWSGVLSSARLPDRPAVVHATASSRVVTRYDRWVNMHRCTGAAFAAMLGGADAFTPRAFAENDPVAQRVARNTATILAAESHLDFVRDPAAGSYALEQLSVDCARAAWESVRELEGQGGFLAGLASGWVQESVERASDDARQRIHTRTDRIVGVSAFPKRDDEPAAVASAPREGAFAPRRDAADFERLRERAEALSERPGVRVIALGDDPSDKALRARIDAALAVAGITVEDDATAVACLAGGTADELAETARRLRADGFGFLLCAGNERIEGVDALLHEACDLHAVLGAVLHHLESVES